MSFTLATAAVVWAPGQSHADEDESVLSINTAVAGFSVPDHSAYGGLLGSDYEYGLTDLIWLRASGGAGAFYDTALEQPVYAGYGEVGVTYVLDLLKYAPHVDLGVGTFVLANGEYEESVLPLISLGAGVDLLTSRTRSMGAFVRFESFLGRSAFFQAGIRTSWRWGFF